MTTTTSTSASTTSSASAGRYYSSLRAHYKLVKPIGKGTQAAVKLWRHIPTSQLVAIKSATSTSFTALSHEAQVLAELHRHNVPGVVPCKGIYSDYENPDVKGSNSCIMKHLVLGYCDKGDLVDLLENKQRRRPHRRVGEDEVCFILKSLVQTLKGCHAMGIAHRDIKLENIFLCSDITNSSLNTDYEALLGDFGLAAKFEKAGQLGFHECEGTLEYMAPEVLHGMYDERADVWSLGVVLHCLLTASFPFTDSNHDRKAIKCRILNQQLDLLGSSSALYADLSYSARHLLSRMLDKNPMTRITLQEIQRHAWLVSHDLHHAAESPAISVASSIISDSSAHVKHGCKRKRSSSESDSHEESSSSVVATCSTNTNTGMMKKICINIGSTLLRLGTSSWKQALFSFQKGQVAH